MIEQVKTKLTAAFESFSKTDGIKVQDVRIRIIKNKDKLKYSLLNKSTFVRDTSLSEMFGGLIAMMAKSELQASMASIIDENNLDETVTNVKVYPLPDNSPSMYLYNEGKAVKQLNIEELLK